MPKLTPENRPEQPEVPQAEENESINPFTQIIEQLTHVGGEIIETVREFLEDDQLEEEREKEE